MAVHIELGELDESREERTPDGRPEVTHLSHDLGKRPIPATLAMKLLLWFRTEPGSDVPIVTHVLSHTGDSVFSRTDMTKVPSTGRGHVIIDLPVTLNEPGSYTVHCTVDDTPWSKIIKLEAP